MEDQTNPIICKGEPTISVPTDIPPSIPPQYSNSGIELILAMAALIRATAWLIQVSTPLLLKRKADQVSK